MPKGEWRQDQTQIFAYKPGLSNTKLTTVAQAGIGWDAYSPRAQSQAINDERARLGPVL